MSNKQGRERAVGILSALIAASIVWLIATLGFGLSLYQPGFGGSAPQPLGIGWVAGVAAVAGLAAWGVLTLVERLSRRPARMWLVIATTVLIGSLGGPLSGDGLSPANRLALVLMHLAVGGVLIAVFYRSARRHEEQDR
jgi:hypothetical protein